MFYPGCEENVNVDEVADLEGCFVELGRQVEG